LYVASSEASQCTGAATIKDTCEIDIDDPLPVIIGLFLNRGDLAADAGIVH
jgi:hypothetical protein